MPPPPLLRPQLAQEPCKFYWVGECNRGIFCSYAHHTGEIGRKFIHYHACRAECKQWQNDGCNQDKYCDFAHTTKAEIYHHAQLLANLEEEHRNKANSVPMALSEKVKSVETHCKLISGGLKYQAPHSSGQWTDYALKPPMRKTPLTSSWWQQPPAPRKLSYSRSKSALGSSSQTAGASSSSSHRARSKSRTRKPLSTCAPKPLSPRVFHNAWEGLDMPVSEAAHDPDMPDLIDAATHVLSVAPETCAEAARWREATLLRELEEESNLSVAAAQVLKSVLVCHDVAKAQGFVLRTPHGQSRDILSHESALCLVETHADPVVYNQLEPYKQLELMDRYPQVVYLPLEDLPHYFDAIKKAACFKHLIEACIEYYETIKLQRKLFKLATTLFAGTSCCFLKWCELHDSIPKGAVKEESFVDSSSSCSSCWIQVDDGVEADDSGSDVTVFSDVDLVQFGVNCAIVPATSRDAGHIV
jgi:hypothetical protein